MRDTRYATEIKTVSDSDGQAIERIYVKEYGREEIRFSWWPKGRMAVRPLDITEDELLVLIRDAIRCGVFSPAFVNGLKKAVQNEGQPEG